MKRMIRTAATLAAIILTAKLGRIQYGDHIETWYNLRMNKVVERADAYYGLSDVYRIRDDGVKTYNGFVIVAADWSKYPFGSVIETSRGVGVVLDYQTSGQPELIDIATAWGKEGKY